MLISFFVPALPMRDRVPHAKVEEVEESLAGQALPAEVNPGAYPKESRRRPFGDAPR